MTGPPGDTGIGFPGPKVSLDILYFWRRYFCHAISLVISLVISQTLILIYPVSYGDKGNQGRPGPTSPMGMSEPGLLVSSQHSLVFMTRYLPYINA